MPKQKKEINMLLGAHISIAGGLEKSIERGENLNINCMQIFTKSNRQWKAKNLSKDEVLIFKKKWQQSFINTIVVHASYLINLGSPQKKIVMQSVNALTLELERCEQLGISSLIIHPGSSQKMPEKQCLKQVADLIDLVLSKVPGKSAIILENMAGQGSSICYQFEQLAFILKEIKEKKRVGVCFDTCHAFAAGYDFKTKKQYDHMWEKFDKIIGLKNLNIIHLNDSKKSLGSRVDRHEFIGKGDLTIEAFSLLMNDKRFTNIPKILETPINTEADYQKDFKVLIKTLSPQHRSWIKKTPLKAYI